MMLMAHALCPGGCIRPLEIDFKIKTKLTRAWIYLNVSRQQLQKLVHVLCAAATGCRQSTDRDATTTQQSNNSQQHRKDTPPIQRSPAASPPCIQRATNREPPRSACHAPAQLDPQLSLQSLQSRPGAHLAAVAAKIDGHINQRLGWHRPPASMNSSCPPSSIFRSQRAQCCLSSRADPQTTEAHHLVACCSCMRTAAAAALPSPEKAPQLQLQRRQQGGAPETALWRITCASLSASPSACGWRLRPWAAAGA
jgi:hypothetical protein